MNHKQSLRNDADKQDQPISEFGSDKYQFRYAFIPKCLSSVIAVGFFALAVMVIIGILYTSSPFEHEQKQIEALSHLFVLLSAMCVVFGVLNLWSIIIWNSHPMSAALVNLLTIVLGFAAIRYLEYCMMVPRP